MLGSGRRRINRPPGVLATSRSSSGAASARGISSKTKLEYTTSNDSMGNLIDVISPTMATSRSRASSFAHFERDGVEINACQRVFGVRQIECPTLPTTGVEDRQRRPNCLHASVLHRPGSDRYVHNFQSAR